VNERADRSTVPAGVSLVALHATFRSPNLKARLGSAREEFRCTKPSSLAQLTLLVRLAQSCWAWTVTLQSHSGDTTLAQPPKHATAMAMLHLVCDAHRALWRGYQEADAIIDYTL
jgi:hypothetical protein